MPDLVQRIRMAFTRALDLALDEAKLAADPPVSEKQRRAMQAAAHGRSTLGIPRAVGKEFVGDAEVTAAGVAVCAPDGALLFLRRGDTGDNPGEWCFPGGNAEDGESPEDAARRELQEETGYAAQTLDGIDFNNGYATFHHNAAEQFAPTLDTDHTEYRWAQPEAPPEPLHPGVAATLKLYTGEYRLPAQDAALFAFDRSVRTFDKDGRLHVELTHISKANICPYRGSEIPDFEALGLDPARIYKLYRHPDELARAAPTFNNIPLLMQHVPHSAELHDPDIVVGATGSDAIFNPPYLDNSLVVWPQEAIDAIESNKQRELSCAYRYRPDMTPGTLNGEAYDGVMRDIVGNHVALVKEGRAGADVVIGDSMPTEFSQMPKISLSKKAAAAQGALLAFLRPKLAQDKKIDVAPLLADVTAANFKDKKAGIAAAIRSAAAKGNFLAKDANLDDIVDLLDALESPEVGADAPEETEEEKRAREEREARERDENDRRVNDEFQKSDEYKAAKDAFMSRSTARDEPPAFPGRPKLPSENTVSRAAMDAAIASATKLATDNAIKAQRAIRDAENECRQWVGNLNIACDSAEDVYRATLISLGVKVDDVHPSALPHILRHLPKPGSTPAPAAAVAMDSKTTQSFYDRFPEAKRIGSA